MASCIHVDGPFFANFVGVPESVATCQSWTAHGANLAELPHLLLLLPPHKLSAARFNVMLSTATASRAAALRPALSFAVRRLALPSSSSDMRVGDAWRETRSFTADDVAAFAELTHDPNPMHSDAEFASDSRFGGRVVHGMLCASMFGAMVGQRFPGAIYLSQTLEFRRPVYLGDTVTAAIAVERLEAAGRVATLSTCSDNQNGERVVDGEARVLLPKTPRRPPAR